MPASVNDYFVIRFCVCAQSATEEDIGRMASSSKQSRTIIFSHSDIAWNIISEIATEVLKITKVEEENEEKEKKDVVKVSDDDDVS